MGYVGLAIPGFRLARGSAGTPTPVLGPRRPINTSGIARAVVAKQQFWKIITGGMVDVCVAADSTTAAANWLGLGELFFDVNGYAVDYNYFLSGATAGYVQCWEGANYVYEGTEDSIGGPMSATGVYTGNCALAVGALDPTVPTPTNPDIISRDLLDSSVKSTTVGTNAFQLMGPVPDISNDGGPALLADGVTTRQLQWSYLFKISIAYKYTS
jgi:hypothetical protein